MESRENAFQFGFAHYLIFPLSMTFLIFFCTFITMSGSFTLICSSKYPGGSKINRGYSPYHDLQTPLENSLESYFHFHQEHALAYKITFILSCVTNSFLKESTFCLLNYCMKPHQKFFFQIFNRRDLKLLKLSDRF